MRVLLVGNYPGLEQESMRRFGDLMLQGLFESGISAELWKPTYFLGRIAFGPVVLRKWIYYIDQFFIAPFFLKIRSRKFTLIHICDHSNAMYGLILGRRPWVVTCHDLLAVRAAKGEFPRIVVGHSGRFLQRVVCFSLLRATCIVCDSKATENDLLRLLSSSNQVRKVVAIAPNRNFSRRSKREIQETLKKMKLELPERFFLHVGGSQWYKNRLGVLELFAALQEEGFAQHHLIYAGKPLGSDVSDRVAQLGLSDSVHSLVSVSDALLEVLYSSAAALLFPSIAEGFGWPIVEAQLCGCPVVTSDRSPMNEVAAPGSAALVNLDEPPKSQARKVRESLLGSAQLKVRGLESANRFNAKLMISGYVETYTQAVAIHDSSGFAVH